MNKIFKPVEFGKMHSCQFVKVDSDFSVNHYACGCIYTDIEKNISILLTVNHVFDNVFDTNNVGVFTCISEKGKALICTSPMHSLILSSNQVIEPIDFRFREVKPGEVFATYECNEEGDFINSRIECEPFFSLGEPNMAETYFFVGRISPKIILEEKEGQSFKKAMFSACCEKIEFFGEHKNYQLKFSLPDNKKIKKNQYQGCSGTPIFNSRGQLISILTSGQEDGFYFYGIDLPTVIPKIEEAILKQKKA